MTTFPVVHTGNRSEILRVGERVLFRTGDLPVRDQCNTGIIRTEEGIVLIDYPEQQPDEEIIGEAEALLGLPVTHILLTHAHGDHRNGLATLHRRDIRLLARESALGEIEACYPSLPPSEARRTAGGDGGAGRRPLLLLAAPEASRPFALGYGGDIAG